MTLFTPFPWIGLGHLHHVFVYNINNKEAHALMIEHSCFFFKHSIFSVTAGLNVKILFILFPVLYSTTLWDKYEAYWLTSFPLINN